MKINLSDWEWKQSKGHEDQPRVEWWAEQLVAVLVRSIAKSAVERNDLKTYNRMLEIARAGERNER